MEGKTRCFWAESGGSRCLRPSPPSRPSTSASPTSRELDGSDAVNVDPDYSAAYAILRTDAGDGLEGHGFAFTIGRGNEVAGRRDRGARAARRRARARGGRSPTSRAFCAPPDRRQPAALARAREGRRSTWRPPRSSTRSGTSAAKREGKPVWQLLARPVARRRSSRSSTSATSTDALTPDEALDLLRERRAPARAERERELRARRAPGLHDLAGLARLRRRQAARAGRRGARRRLRRTSSSRSAPTPRTTCAAAAIAREVIGDRAAPDASTPTRPGTSARRSSACARLAPFGIALDRGADEPRRRARPRRDRARASRRSASPPASTRRTG